MCNKIHRMDMEEIINLLPSCEDVITYFGLKVCLLNSLY